MNVTLTDAQTRKIHALLFRLDRACSGSLKPQNLIRMINLELLRAERRAKRSAFSKRNEKENTSNFTQS